MTDRAAVEPMLGKVLAEGRVSLSADDAKNVCARRTAGRAPTRHLHGGRTPVQSQAKGPDVRRENSTREVIEAPTTVYHLFGK
jgi:hypothetical protein